MTTRHYVIAKDAEARRLIEVLKTLTADLSGYGVDISFTEPGPYAGVVWSVREMYSELSFVIEKLETECLRKAGELQEGEAVFLCCQVGRCFVLFVEDRGGQHTDCPHCEGKVASPCPDCTPSGPFAEADRRDALKRKALLDRIAAEKKRESELDSLH